MTVWSALLLAAQVTVVYLAQWVLIEAALTLRTYRRYLARRTDRLD